MQNINKYALVPRFQNKNKINYIDQNRFYKLENAFVFQTRKEKIDKILLNANTYDGLQSDGLAARDHCECRFVFILKPN